MSIFFFLLLFIYKQLCVDHIYIICLGVDYYKLKEKKMSDCWTIKKKLDKVHMKKIKKMEIK